MFFSSTALELATLTVFKAIRIKFTFEVKAILFCPQNSIDDTALKKRQDDGRTFDIKMYSFVTCWGYNSSGRYSDFGVSS